MSQVSDTLFRVMQPTMEVVSNLLMPPYLREVKGEQFVMTLRVPNNADGEHLLDVYVVRLPPGAGAESFTRKVDGSKEVSTEASIDPEGETFGIEITFERAKLNREVRPSVRVADRMFELLRASLERHEQDAVAAFLRDAGHA